MNVALVEQSDARNAARLRRVLVIVALLVAASGAEADEIRLRQSAVDSDGTIYLSEIAELQGDKVEALGSVVIAALQPRQRQTHVTLEDVRRQLSSESINWATTTLGGFSRCRVSRENMTDIEADTVAETAATEAAGEIEPGEPGGIANPLSEVDLNRAATVREEILRQIEQQFDVDRGDLTVTESPRDRELLDTSLLQDRVEVELHAQSLAGRLPVSVRFWRGGEVSDQQRVMLTVTRRVIAVVSTGQIRRGQTITSADVMMQEVTLDRSRGEVLTDMKQVLGKIAGISIRPDTVLHSGDVAAPLLVRRGDKVSVRTLTGNLAIRLDCKALEDGAAVEIIRVRNDLSRGEFRVKVVGRRSAVLANASQMQMKESE